MIRDLASKDPLLPSMKGFLDITGYLAPKQHAHTFAGEMPTKRSTQKNPAISGVDKSGSKMFMKDDPYLQHGKIWEQQRTSRFDTVHLVGSFNPFEKY